jgi:ferrochelatase
MPVTVRPSPASTHEHGLAPATAVLLCNLGTPDAPTPEAVRRYLAEFLGDPRVVEIPRAAWLPILYGAILPLRSRRSAHKYQTIWMPEGSPLKVWTERQAKRLQGWLGERGHRVRVAHAMRYGHPAIAQELDALADAGVGRILILTAYPQYSGTTTASVIDAVNDWTRTRRHIPELRFVNRYHDDRGYVRALAHRIERHWREHGRPEHLVLSFHGIPERTVLLGDPYEQQCRETARLLAEWLELAPEQYTLGFQSRFGKAKWLEPYTQPTVEALARRGVRRLDVVCPGFVADCLETLEEIGMEVRDAFLASGGKEYRYIPCLNDETEWIKALGEITLQHLAGWNTQGPTATA